jgi:hypothetical protein
VIGQYDAMYTHSSACGRIYPAVLAASRLSWGRRKPGGFIDEPWEVNAFKDRCNSKAVFNVALVRTAGLGRLPPIARNASANPDGSSNGSLMFASRKASPWRSVSITNMQLTVRHPCIFVNRKPVSSGAGRTCTTVIEAACICCVRLFSLCSVKLKAGDRRLKVRS